jgi:predicted RNase H-like HicB family nuclease
MEKKQWGITQLYNAYFHEPASKLYQLHQQLDKLVMQAYNFKANDDILAKLLELNLDITLKPPRSDWLPKFGGLRGKSKQLNVKQQLFRCPLRFEKSEEGYAVWCPGLPGCCSQVETETEALEIYPQVYAKALKDSLRSHLRSLS